MASIGYCRIETLLAKTESQVSWLQEHLGSSSFPAAYCKQAILMTKGLCPSDDSVPLGHQGQLLNVLAFPFIHPWKPAWNSSDRVAFELPSENCLILIYSFPNLEFSVNWVVLCVPLLYKVISFCIRLWGSILMHVGGCLIAMSIKIAARMGEKRYRSNA